MTPELELIKQNRTKRNPSPCPFTLGIPGGSGECMHCYELFPGWGDMYMNHYNRRSFRMDSNGEGPRLTCPCNTLGESFVKKTVEAMLCSHS